MPLYGDRVELTTQIETLGNIARPGDQGTVTGVHTGGHLTVVMDNGRPAFPQQDEVRPAQ